MIKTGFFVFLWIWPEPVRGSQREENFQKTSLKARKKFSAFRPPSFLFFKLVSSTPWPFCCFYIMYASFRSVKDKNSKILTPTRTGNFLLTSMDREFYTTDSLVKCICWKKQSTKEHTNNPAVSALPWSGTLSWDDDIIPSEWSAWNLVKGFDCFSIFFFFLSFSYLTPSQSSFTFLHFPSRSLTYFPLH